MISAKLEAKFRVFLLRALLPVSKFIGTFKIHRKKTVSLDDAMLIIEGMRPGDIILSKGDWVITNLLIPGKYKHASMFVGHGMCVEAMYPKVKATSLYSLLNRVDHAVLVRPKFANKKQMEEAASVMQTLIGSDYDLLFDPDNKAFYCSECVWYSYRRAVPDWHFEARLIVGVQTVTPSDIYKAEKDFKILKKLK